MSKQKLKKRVLAAVEAGGSYVSVAKRYSLCTATVSKWVRAAQEAPAVQRVTASPTDLGLRIQLEKLTAENTKLRALAARFALDAALREA